MEISCLAHCWFPATVQGELLCEHDSCAQRGAPPHADLIAEPPSALPARAKTGLCVGIGMLKEMQRLNEIFASRKIRERDPDFFREWKDRNFFHREDFHSPFIFLYTN